MWHIVNRQTDKQIVINDTCRGFYQSRASVVRALKTSRVLADLGLCWNDVILRDHWGQSMEDRASVAILANRFALRHTENWYWVNPGSKRIWYRSASVLDGAWKQGELWLRQIEGRSGYVNPGRAGFQLVKGLDNGDVTVYLCRYQ